MSASTFLIILLFAHRSLMVVEAFGQVVVVVVQSVVVDTAVHHITETDKETFRLSRNAVQREAGLCPPSLLRVQSFHSQWSQQFLLGDLQSLPGPLRCEHLWSLWHKHMLGSELRSGTAHKPFEASAHHHHGDGEIGSQLVVTPGAGSSVAVLINASLMHQLRVLFIWVRGILRHPELRFKGLLELLVPLSVGDEHLFTWNTADTMTVTSLCGTMLAA